MPRIRLVLKSALGDSHDLVEDFDFAVTTAADVEVPSKKPRVEPSAAPDENEDDVADVFGDFSDGEVEEPDAKRARRVPADDDIDERHPPGDYRRHRGLAGVRP